MSFPRYPKYKDSGVEWLGEVPEHWGVDRFKTSVQTCRNGIWGAEVQGNADDVPCVRVADFDRQRLRVGLDIPTIRNVTASERDGRILSRGDLLLEKSGGGESQPVGCVMLYEDDAAAICSNFVARVQLAAGMVPSFWRYAHAAAYTVRLNTRSIKQTSGIQNLDQQQYLDERAAFPPSAEQAAIASFLDRETAKIDALIAEQQRLVGLLDEQLKALALCAFNAPSTVMVRLGAATDVISRPLLGESGTTYTRLGLYNRGRGIFHKDPSEPEEMGDSDFFWVEEGDLILSGQFAWEGAVAIAGPEESRCVVSHRYPIVRGKAGILRTEFLFALLCTAHGDFLLNENSRGAAGRNRPLNIGSLLKEKVPVPDIRLQDKAAQIYHQRQGLLKEVEIQQALLQERRSALISAAVTGQIDVRGLAGSEAA
jgi:type I restriction enzyme S subunit